MLIDHTYFSKGPRQIQNATLGGAIPDANAMKVCSMIDAYVAEYQEEYLSKMLGGALGNKVNAYVVCLDEDGEEAHRHIGTYDAICAQLREPFADYVFFHILRDVNTQVTDTGIVMLKCANMYVSPIRKQVSVWNTMVDRHRRFREWCASEGHEVEVSAGMLEKINVLNL